MLWGFVSVTAAVATGTQQRTRARVGCSPRALLLTAPTRHRLCKGTGPASKARTAECITSGPRTWRDTVAQCPVDASTRRRENPAIVVIGTRGSPLALAQAHETKRLLEEAHPFLRDREGAIHIEIIHTTGDIVLDRALSEIGGKGLFTREIDEAQLRGDIDIAVHSMKDVPTFLPPDIELTSILRREDTRDAFVSFKAKSLDELPPGSVVGSSSLRRQSQILARYPHLKVINFRGNVQTRLRKLEECVVDATLLALAGLRRLQMEHVATAVLGMEDMLPAVAQGAIGITTRRGDDRTAALLGPLSCPRTKLCVEAERAFLANLDGSCRTPIAGQAWFDTDSSERIHFRGLVATPDGRDLFETTRQCTPANVIDECAAAGTELRDRVGPDFYASLVNYVQERDRAEPGRQTKSKRSTS
jgi:hydroxymethylbilane synthase